MTTFHRMKDAWYLSGFDENYKKSISLLKRGKAESIVHRLRAHRPLVDDDFDLLADFFEERNRPVGRPSKTFKKMAARRATEILASYRHAIGEERILDPEKSRGIVAGACRDIEEMYHCDKLDVDEVIKQVNRPKSRSA
ncbi:hypothetical protein [Mesorhizobium marinum]|uniref:Uncharacterized protein n=1 Tax=Mesorhizobium marinum TaxID=3228790 RepID=A0ABV3R0K1_9HYPH